MRIAVIIALLAVTYVQTGCVGPFAPAGIYAKSDSELERESTGDLARTYGQQRGGWPGKPERFETELRRRNAFTAEQWSRIQKRNVRQGDTSEFVLAAWGPPDDSLHQTSSNGASALWIYSFKTTRPEARGTVYFVGNSVSSITQ